jgi:hypothetical protein
MIQLDEIERRLEIALRRRARFFSDGGLCDRYESRGDHLVQFHEIVNWLTSTVPGLNRDAVIARFRFSAKNHGLGRHGRRQTIELLVDLDDFSSAPRGMYSLRPSYIRVETFPEAMRARRSVWVQWLQAQGWPVPPELGRSILIKASSVELPTGQPASPAASAGPALPPSVQPVNAGSRPSKAAVNKFVRKYICKAKEERKLPSFNGLQQAAKAAAFKATRSQLQEAWPEDRHLKVGRPSTSKTIRRK